MASDEKAMFTKVKGQFNYRTWCQDMEAACGGENALKILHGELPCPKMSGSPEGLTRRAFIEAVLKPEATVEAVKDTSSTGKEKEKGGTDLTDRELVNERFQEYKEEWELYNSWKIRDSKALSILRRHIEPNCLPTIQGATSSNDAWTRCK